MRLIVSLLVLAAVGYLGYTYYTENRLPMEEETVEVAPAPAATAAASKAPLPIAPPAFQSKIEIPGGAPGEKHIAPPGTYYMLDRVTKEHATGIAALIPGDKVNLMQRKGDGTVKVTTGRFDFEVKDSQITNDLDIARAAEEKYAIAHPLKQ